MIGHNPELKGDVHPIQCPANALGEVNEEYTYEKASAFTQDTLQRGQLWKDHRKVLDKTLC